MSPVYRTNVSWSPHTLALSFGALLTSASSTTSSIPDISGAVSAFPHSLAATSSFIGTSASGGSHGGDLQIIPAHTALYTPSPSSPIPSSLTSSLSRSGDIPSRTGPLATSSANAPHPTPLRNTTVPPQQQQQQQQQQSAPLLPDITPDFPRPVTSYKS
ncbi:hypothetical protein BJY52DRAFT_1314844 [Lactarius psammicola]|nr:hypothetical protein BJY52DRAFT_1314844 [Lactarius psammicola]